MTPRARLGQLFLLGVPANGTGHLDAVIVAEAPGGVFLAAGRSGDGTAATATFLTRSQSIEKDSGVGIFAAVDQQGGQVQVLSGPGFSTMPSATAHPG